MHPASVIYTVGGWIVRCLQFNVLQCSRPSIQYYGAWCILKAQSYTQYNKKVRYVLTISTPCLSAFVAKTSRLPIITVVRGAAAEIQNRMGLFLLCQQHKTAITYDINQERNNSGTFLLGLERRYNNDECKVTKPLTM